MDLSTYRPVTLRRVEVVWIDSSSYQDGWHSADDYRSHNIPTPIVSSGYLLEEGKDSLMLVSNVQPEHAKYVPKVADAIIIPLTAIVSVHALRKGESLWRNNKTTTGKSSRRSSKPVARSSPARQRRPNSRPAEESPTSSLEPTSESVPTSRTAD